MTVSGIEGVPRSTVCRRQNAINSVKLNTELLSQHMMGNRPIIGNLFLFHGMYIFYGPMMKRQRQKTR